MPSTTQNDIFDLLIIINECSYSSELESRLSKGGYNINSQDENGNTLLHYAIRRGKYDAIPILIKYGADIWIENGKGDTPMCEAVAQKNSQSCIDMLILTDIFKNEAISDLGVHKYFVDDSEVNIDKYLQRKPTKRKLEEVSTENMENKRARI